MYERGQSLSAYLPQKLENRQWAHEEQRPLKTTLSLLQLEACTTYQKYGYSLIEFEFIKGTLCARFHGPVNSKRFMGKHESRPLVGKCCTMDKVYFSNVVAIEVTEPYSCIVEDGRPRR